MPFPAVSANTRMRIQEALHALPDHLIQYIYSEFCPEMACGHTAVNKRFCEVLCDLPGVVIRPKSALQSEVIERFFSLVFHVLIWYA
jgi:hypothetical protein